MSGSENLQGGEEVTAQTRVKPLRYRIENVQGIDGGTLVVDYLDENERREYEEAEQRKLKEQG